MRYVSSILPATSSLGTRQAKALSAAAAVKPVHVPGQTVPYVEHHVAFHGADVLEAVQQRLRNGRSGHDRRKAQRRVSHRPVLEELRSGIDRRRHNIFEGAVAEHIDEIA